jgi:glutathione S-transferase
MDAPLLWHIPLSHYNEKVRWALDYKGIAHRRRVLGPDYLIRVWRATGQGKLPVLWLDGRAIADSTRIIAALEDHYPEPPLYPRDVAMRQRALTLEDDLDETLGPALRAAIVTPLFRHDPDVALRVLTTGMGGKAYPTLRPLLRIFPSFYRFRHRISESNLERDRAIVATALDRIEHQRQGRTYLVGEAFTVADLTAASLLGALLQPPEIQYPLEVELPLYLKDYRAKLLRHPAVQWAAGIYRLHRGTLGGSCKAHSRAVSSFGKMIADLFISWERRRAKGRPLLGVKRTCLLAKVRGEK